MLFPSMNGRRRNVRQNVLSASNPLNPDDLEWYFRVVICITAIVGIKWLHAMPRTEMMRLEVLCVPSVREWSKRLCQWRVRETKGNDLIVTSRYQ
mmetsp:Transcript_28610/g.68883  ORF Transcript_28610/g.68883 Transcript_28610/m.68883 type:complete len:95 (+) Transcript_28610:663-947(+)